MGRIYIEFRPHGGLLRDNIARMAASNKKAGPKAGKGETHEESRGNQN